MSNKKILVVDDEHNIADLLMVVLTGAGYTVRAAYNGVEGLREVQSFQPNLVILDVNMPQLDGWGVLSSIRATEATRKLPVLMCTQRDLISDVERAEMLGASGYIAKPFEIDRVLHKVQQMLSAPA
ncbi:MAG TPA: response regulator [Elusimicrobiota bacterium]|nr:response regulator [Elusimicrobiota bacterium]